MKVHFITLAVEDDGLNNQYFSLKYVLRHVLKDPPGGLRCVVLGTDTHDCGDRKLKLAKYKAALEKKK